MMEEHDRYFQPRRRVVYAMLVFTVLAALLNTGIFVNWAREAPFSPEITEWLIVQADRVDSFGRELGFNLLHDRLASAIEELRSR